MRVQYRAAVSGAVTAFSSPNKLRDLLPALFGPHELVAEPTYHPVRQPMHRPHPLSGPYGKPSTRSCIGAVVVLVWSVCPLMPWLISVSIFLLNAPIQVAVCAWKWL